MDPLNPQEAPATAGRRLLTLVHISDLHFGHPPAEEGGAPPADLRRHFKMFDGLLGHHFPALDHLTTYMKLLRLQETDPAPIVVLTGDLTACGRTEEFKRAKDFVGSSYMVGANPIGLNEADFSTRTIPGNHDNWPGTGEILGPRTEAFKTLFGMPMTMFERTLASGHQFQLFGIDSDADVEEVSWDRFLARGSFESEVERLDQANIPAPTGNQIRALLLHHSPVHLSMMTVLEARTKSLHALDDWMAKSGVSVILTGHLHDALGHVRSVSDRGKTWDLLEARCGTTTQLDRATSKWKGKGTWNADRLPVNSLLVHRLMEYDHEIRWEIEFVERLHDGFMSRKPLPGLARQSIVVWSANPVPPRSSSRPQPRA